MRRIIYSPKEKKKNPILLELEDKEQWKLSEKQKGIEKKKNFCGSCQKDFTKKEQWLFDLIPEASSKGMRAPHSTSHKE